MRNDRRLGRPHFFLKTLSMPAMSKARLAALILAVPPLSWSQNTSQVLPEQTVSVPGTPTTLAPQISADSVAPTSTAQVLHGKVESGDKAVDYSVNASAAKIVVMVSRNAVPADGQTPVTITLRVMGADGNRLSQAVWATLESSAGRIQLPGAATDEMGPRAKDADRTTPGVQLQVKNGVATFNLLAPDTPQDVQLRVTIGQQVASGVISFVPEMRDMIAAGLVEGVLNFHGKSNGIVNGNSSNGFDQQIAHWSREFSGGKNDAEARAAFFLKGTIKGEYLLTAAYDSDKETRARAVAQIQPQEYYPIYGDASIKGMDAKSSSRLYVRLDSGKSFLLYGDFATGEGFSQTHGGGTVASLQQRSLGNSNRSATGLRYHYEQDQITGNVFAFRDTLRQVVEELASQGTGPYGLHNSNVLEGSEKVEVLVRDRNQPSRILTVTPLARLSDYSFEPFSGRIILNSFLPGADANLNPMSLRITYEVDQGGTAFWVLGADGQLRLSDKIEVGGSYLKDQNPLAPQQISSANVGLHLGPKTALVAEIAHTSGEVNTNSVNATSQASLANRSGEISGNAWRVELAHEQDAAEVHAFVGRSDPTFNNLAAPLNGGRGEASVAAAVKLSDSVKVYTQAMRSEDRNPGGAQATAVQVGVKATLTERLSVDLGLRSLHQNGNPLSSGFEPPFSSAGGLGSSLGAGAGGGAVGFGNQSIDPATGLPSIQQGSTPVGGVAGATNNTSLHSNSLRAAASFKVTDKATLTGEIEDSVSGDARRRIALGGDYQVAERTKLYARAERQTGVSGPDLISTPYNRGNAFVLGVDSSYLQDTHLFNEYALRDAAAGRDLQMASGVRNTWNLGEGVRATAAAEHTQVLWGAVPSTNAISLGLDYTANPLWKGSTKVEWRRSGDIADTEQNETFSTKLWQAMVARKLDRDWTALARNYLLKTDYAATGAVLQDRLQLGLAYRDTDSNKVNALGKVEIKNERDNSNAAAGDLSSRATILSTHVDWHPKRPLWLTGRLAAKWQNDTLEGGLQNDFRAQLVSGRLVYDLTENWDLGLLAALQNGQYNTRQRSFGAELGYLVKQNLWLSVGYNRTGFSADSDLVGNDFTQRGAYLRLRFKFDENLFMNDSPDVNRSLDRTASGTKK